MTVFTKRAVDVFAPVTVSGMARGADMGDAMTWGTAIEAVILPALSAGSGTIRTSLASLNANLAYPAATMAWVIGDDTAENNGIYQKSGASGSGSWVRVADLPYSFVQMFDAGTGTANAIKVTSGLPTSRSVLRISNVFRANTGNVTISENGGAAKALKTVNGEQIAAGNLVAGMSIAYLDNGTEFRLITDPNSLINKNAALAAQAAAEAAQAASEAAQGEAEDAQAGAEAARDIAAGYASDAVSQGNVPIYATAAGLAGIAIPPGIDAIRVNGQNSVGDGEGGEYIDLDNGSERTVVSGDGRIWYRTNINRRRYVDVGDYCPLNDTQDATAGFAAALAAGEGREIVITNPYGGSRTYKVAGMLTIPGGAKLINAGNAQIDFTGGPTTVFDGTLFTSKGTMGTPVSVTAGVLPGDMTVPVASTTGFGSGDWVYLGSTSEKWDITDDNCLMGEVHKVKSVGTGTLTFYEPVMYPMTADLTVAKINYNAPIRMEGVKAFGKPDSTSHQFGADLRMVKNFVAEDVDFTFFEDRCFWIWRCLNPQFRGGTIGHCHYPGLSYPIQFAGSTYYAKVNGTHFVDARHGLDFGDIYGVNRFAHVEDITCQGIREAALSTHTAADHITFDGFTVTCDDGNPLASGSMFRSINTTAKNGRIIRPNTNAMYLLMGPRFAGAEAFENIVVEGAAGGNMVHVQDVSAGGSRSISVQDCDLDARDGATATGVLLRSSGPDSFQKVQVANTRISGVSVGVHVRIGNTASMPSVAIQDCDITASGPGNPTGVLAQNEGTGSFGTVRVQDNGVFGPAVAFGYREINTGGGSFGPAIVTGNDLRAAATKTSVVSGASLIDNNLV